MSATPRAGLERLLRPRSVAIVGASATPGALGASVLENLERAAFAGDIHLVNPKRSEIGGRPCIASIDELPKGVDCVVFAVPQAAVMPTLAACVRREVGSAIIFSAGFAEGGDVGRAEQAEIRRLAVEHKIAIEGPNCLGLVNYVDGIPLTFVRTANVRLGERRGIGIVSQSGAMAAVLGVGLTSRDVGISFSISTGNEAVTGVEDYVEYLLNDANTRVITMIVEQFRAPARFLDLARRCRAAGKLIALLHPGRGNAARESAVTHTGAMAGDYEVMRTLVTHAGVALVDTLEELLDLSELALRGNYLPTAGACVLTESGAFKALTLDLCEQVGLALPALGADAEQGLRQAMPDFIPPDNPLDLTAQALVDPDLYRRTLSVMGSDTAYGSVVLAIILTDEATSRLKIPPIVAALAALALEKPVIFCGLDEGAAIPQACIEQLRQLDVTFFPSPERAFRALARWTDWATRPRPAAQAGIDDRPPMLVTPGILPEYRSKTVLADWDIAIPSGALATTLAAAHGAAAQIGYPVALKAQAADLSHKSDAGGVVLGLGDAVALADGWARLHRDVAAARPGLVLDGVLVEAMAKRGVELIIGARAELGWGPVLMVGFGGVMAELIQDVRLLPPGLPPRQIVQELMKLKGAALFTGFRGSPPLDLEAVSEMIAQLGSLVRAEGRIKEIDINPVVVYAAGEGAVALDALIAIE